MHKINRLVPQHTNAVEILEEFASCLFLDLHRGPFKVGQYLEGVSDELKPVLAALKSDEVANIRLDRALIMCNTPIRTFDIMLKDEKLKFDREMLGL